MKEKTDENYYSHDKITDLLNNTDTSIEKEEGVQGKKSWLKREVCGKVQRNDESLRWLCLDGMELRSLFISVFICLFHLPR